MDDRDTQEQVDMFNDYLIITESSADRTRVGSSLSHSEDEWEAFQYGWNACKKHFGVE
jgi:hypothetical protein